MADELVVHQDALQIPMSPEADAEHVPDLPLEPISACPERTEGIHLWLSFLAFPYRDLKSQPVFERQGKEVVDDDEAFWSRGSGPGVLVWDLGRGSRWHRPGTSGSP